MPTYFDPILLEDTLLNENTNVYLVKIGDNKFCIKGISSGLDRLPSDPTTHSIEYWPIPVKTLISLSNNEILFKEEKLTTAPLTEEQINQFFKFNPNETPPTKFDSAIKNQLTNEWTEGIIRDEIAQSGFNPHSFFFQPIFLQAHQENPNQNSENAPQHIPAILVLHFMPAPAEGNDEEIEETAHPLVLLMLVMNHEHQEENQVEEENQSRP